MNRDRREEQKEQAERDLRQTQNHINTVIQAGRSSPREWQERGQERQQRLSLEHERE